MPEISAPKLERKHDRLALVGLMQGPVGSTQDSADCVNGNGECGGESLHSPPSAAIQVLNTDCVSLVQPCCPMRAAVLGAIAPSSFGDGIDIIIGVGSEKQMVWPNTKPHVAVMADELSVGDSPAVDFVRETMGKDHRPTRWPRAQCQQAVSLVVGVAVPEPTTISPFDIPPETLLWSPSSRHTSSKVALGLCQ